MQYTDDLSILETTKLRHKEVILGQVARKKQNQDLNFNNRLVLEPEYLSTRLPSLKQMHKSILYNPA